MPRIRIGRPKPRIEQLLQPQLTTVQMPGSVLEAALVNALQPLYREMADLKQAQVTSHTALRSLTERLRSQESTLMQLLTQLQDSLNAKPSAAMESQLQRLLNQLRQTSSDLSALASSLQTTLQRRNE